MKYFETKKGSLEEAISKAVNEKPDSSRELKESKMGAFFLDMQIDANEMSERDFIKKYQGEMGMTARELKDLYREMTEGFSDMNAKDLEEKAGKYLKYSDLLLQKGRLMAKNKNTTMIDREIEKEKKRLGIKDEVVREATGDKEKYQAFFNKAMKKFGVNSPAELKGDKKKEFFNYVDKNYKGDHEEELDKEDKPTVQKVIDKLKKASKAHADQSKSLEKDLQDNVDKTLDKIRESNVEKSKSMRSILADIWQVNEGKNPFEKDEGFASDAQRRAAFASGYKEKGKKKNKKEEDEKTLTGEKPTKVEIEPVVEGKSMVAIDKKNKMKYLFHDGQKVEYNGKPYETGGVMNQQVTILKGRGRDEIKLSKREIEEAFKTGKFKVIDIGNNPQHAVKI
tara:strand:- start:1871 stop:3055 length:1185 start_codon:yes stop_codon:yes gene_type:complete